MAQTTRMRDHLKVSLEGQGVVHDADALVRGIKARLQPTILCRDARRALVSVTPQRLDAADREHETASNVYQVGAECNMSRDLTTCCDLAGSDQRHVIPEPVPSKRIVNSRQAIDQR